MIPTKSPFKQLLGCGAVVLSCFSPGCSKPAASSTSAAEVQKTFTQTRSDIREFAEQGVAAESKNDYGTAFVHYRALSLNPDLTSEQRNSANQAMLEMGKRLRDAAGKG